MSQSKSQSKSKSNPNEGVSKKTVGDMPPTVFLDLSLIHTLSLCLVGCVCVFFVLCVCVCVCVKPVVVHHSRLSVPFPIVPRIVATRPFLPSIFGVLFSIHFRDGARVRPYLLIYVGNRFSEPRRCVCGCH